MNLCRTLQRIAIRLHIVLRVVQVKRAMAVHTVSACPALEQQRLEEAGKTIMVCSRPRVAVDQHVVQTVLSVQTLNELKSLKTEAAKLQPAEPVTPNDMYVSYHSQRFQL